MLRIAARGRGRIGPIHAANIAANIAPQPRLGAVPAQTAGAAMTSAVESRIVHVSEVEEHDV